MKSFQIKSIGSVELEGHLWVASESFPEGCKESVTIRKITYYKMKKVK